MGWSVKEMPDQHGRRAVVTGATSGIGREVAKALAARGARVIITARDPGRGEAARADVLRAAPGASVQVLACDLSDLESVRDAASALAAAGEPLELLVNNAGVMAVPRRMESAQGHELQFATNHLGHFALTLRLLPLLARAVEARVVTVSSLAHRVGRLDLGDVDRVRGYGAWPAYCGSKLANAEFTIELDRRLRAAGSAIRSVGAHPGFARTGLQWSGPGLGGFDLSARVVQFGTVALGQSAAAGALPVLRAATDPEVPGGAFVGPGWPGELRGPPRRVAFARRAHAPAPAAALWALSEELTGVVWEPPTSA